MDTLTHNLPVSTLKESYTMRSLLVGLANEKRFDAAAILFADQIGRILSEYLTKIHCPTMTCDASVRVTTYQNNNGEGFEIVLLHPQVGQFLKHSCFEEIKRSQPATVFFKTDFNPPETVVMNCGTFNRAK